MDIPVYNKEGKKKGTVTVPEHVFNLPWNADLVHQCVQAMQANRRTGAAHTKDRSEVSGGGRKPWRQKGTGRARHGSRRSPIWIGGGTTFGPRSEKDYSRKINKKVRLKSLFVALSEKLRQGEVLFVDDMTIPEIKTKTAATILKNLATIKAFERLGDPQRNTAYVVAPETSETFVKSFQNIPGIGVGTVQNLNTLDVLQYQRIVIINPEQSINVLEDRLQRAANRKVTA